jgi:site-specific recombinase XerD
MEPTLDVPALLDTYLRSRVRRGDMLVATAAGIRPQLYRFADSFGKRVVPNITERSTIRWLEHIGHLAPGTRRNNWSNVSRFIDWLAVEGYVRGNPMRHMQAPAVPRRLARPLPSDDVRRILETCRDDDRLLLAALLGVQCASGSARSSGCRSATSPSPPAPSGLSARAPTSACCRSPRRLGLPSPGTCARWAPRPPVLRSIAEPGRPVSRSWLGHAMSDVMAAAGVKGSSRDGVSMHALRHTAATDMLRHGAHVRDVQAALGHAHLVTTERYLSNVVRGLADAMEGRRYLAGAGA